MPMYLVVGLYLDQNPPQRFGDELEADSPAEAERLTAETHPDVQIAGVIDMTTGFLVA